MGQINLAKINIIAGCLPLALIGCRDPSFAVGSSECEVVSSELSLTQETAIGFTADDLHRWVSDTYSRVEVTWQEGSEPSSDVFELLFENPIMARENHTPSSTTCAQATWLEANTSMSAITEDGEIDASCVATIIASDLNDASVFLLMDCEVDVTGTHLAALEKEFDLLDRVELSGYSLPMYDVSSGPAQRWALVGWGEVEGSKKSDAVFRCYEDDGTDCFHPVVPSQ